MAARSFLGCTSKSLDVMKTANALANRISPRSVRYGRAAAVGVSALALATAVSACGSDKPSVSHPTPSTVRTTAAQATSGSPAAATSNPCMLLTDADVSSLIGHATRTGPVVEFRGNNCKWNADSARLVVTVYQGSGFYAPDMQASHPRYLSGVGDGAYVDGGTAAARVGETVVFVHLIGFGPAAAGQDGALEHALRSAVSRV